MNQNKGHRKRLDQKIKRFGFEMLEAHEQLEHILFSIIPRRDTNKIAHRLIERFGSVAGVLNANVDELVKIEGVGERTAMFLNSLMPLLGVVERAAKSDAPPELVSKEQIYSYIKTFFYGKLVETAYVFSLNSTYHLLGVAKVSVGGKDETCLHAHTVVQQAVRDNASAVIVAHNHPCGMPNPSKADVLLSWNLKNAFAAVNIEYVDCIIFSDDLYFSLRENGFMEDLEKDLEGIAG